MPTTAWHLVRLLTTVFRETRTKLFRTKLREVCNKQFCLELQTGETVASRGMAQLQREVTYNELGDGKYLLTWLDEGNCQQHHLTTILAIEAEFPLFCEAVRSCKEELNPDVPLASVLICAAYTYAEVAMRRKRFQVYRHVAWAVGWRERTRFPLALEQAIKQTWHNDQEVFVGFVEE